jgi:hypothetical protein
VKEKPASMRSTPAPLSVPHPLPAARAWWHDHSGRVSSKPPEDDPILLQTFDLAIHPEGDLIAGLQKSRL